MFERFTAEAREAVRLAQDEARTLHHGFIGTEHLLLGLLGSESSASPAAEALRPYGLRIEALRKRIAYLAGDGLDAEALATLGIDLDQVRAATEAQLGPGALDRRDRLRKPCSHIPLTKRAKKVLELSLREALRLGSSEVGSGHLLLGLIRDSGTKQRGAREGMAARLLREAGIDMANLRLTLERLITSRAA